VPIAPGGAGLDEQARTNAANAGRLIEGTTSDWLLNTLRWEARTLDQSLLHVRDTANRVSNFRRGLTAFAAPCFLGGRAWWILIAKVVR
jgi:hypothetical protein